MALDLRGEYGSGRAVFAWRGGNCRYTNCVSRIRRGYEARFRNLLRRARARRLEQGVQRLVERARRMNARGDLSLAEALAEVYERLATTPALRPPDPPAAAREFLCDAGLGGLARWLRAAGYEARWQPYIADDELLRQARATGATVLTTDGMLMERRVLRDGVIPSFWLPPTLSLAEQLRLVLREFGLSRRAPRCMSCGGALRAVSKEALRARIPPRTYRWRDDYFVCVRCDKLFWHGTHWQRIVGALEAAKAGQGAEAGRA
jgi:uncharacterized protein